MKLTELKPSTVYRTTGDDQFKPGRLTHTRWLFATGTTVEIVETVERIRNPKSVSRYVRNARPVKRARLYRVADTDGTPWLSAPAGTDHVDLRGQSIYAELCALDGWPAKVAEYRAEQARLEAERRAEGETQAQIVEALRSIIPHAGPGFPPNTLGTWMQVVELIEAADRIVEAGSPTFDIEPDSLGLAIDAYRTARAGIGGRL